MRPFDVNTWQEFDKRSGYLSWGIICALIFCKKAFERIPELLYIGHRKSCVMLAIG